VVGLDDPQLNCGTGIVVDVDYYYLVAQVDPQLTDVLVPKMLTINYRYLVGQADQRPVVLADVDNYYLVGKGRLTHSWWFQKMLIIKY
jgi:hypothetical protein